MRMYVSEESSKKTDRVSKRTGDSPEKPCAMRVDYIDQEEAEAPRDDAGASGVPKTG